MRRERERQESVELRPIEDIIQDVRSIYSEFTDINENPDEEEKKGGLMGIVGGNLLRWVAGNRIHTDQESDNDEFVSEVTKLMRQMELALNNCETAEQQAACMQVADIMLASHPAKRMDNLTLMLRAVSGQFKPFLVRLKREDLEVLYHRFTAAYPKRLRYPVESDLIAEMERILSEK